jgi:transketolase
MKGETDLRNCRDLALAIRRHVLRMTHGRGSHIGSCYSIADLIAVLYGDTLRIKPTQSSWPDRDRFILSKGHGCAALYAALSEREFFPASWLDTFYQNGARLASHATHWGVPGVEASTGSLGHGLALACGMAIAGKRDNKTYRVFALLSDGECDEGSTWEAALFAPSQDLNNLVVLVDYNKIQSLGRVQEVLDLEPFAAKWTAFGWSVQEIDGHDLREIAQVLSSVPFKTGKPSCVIAHTVKGKGVSFMEDELLWHYRAPNDEEFEEAMLELERRD